MAVTNTDNNYNNNNNMSTLSGLRDLLVIDDENSTRKFCTINNYDDAVDILFGELEAFEVGPLTSTSSLINMTADCNKKSSTETLLLRFVKLINSTWNLIHKHRNLMREHEKLKDQQSRIFSDNSALSNHVKRLKQAIEKKDNALSEIEEKERQLKVKVSNLTRELKREKEESAKLKKQIQSKDIQHAHELRRIQLNGNKLRDQLQKSVGKFVPKSKAAQNLQTEHDKKIYLYKQTINRLEENNSLMLQEINDLKDALELHAGGLELHVESSGIWDETTTE
ncbi:hypothetical protein PV326_002490 [Microctonus aethiopoides]|nr:hypothetical protein PV326_002490 [Microctonus aethiopoides]